ncbi:MAG: AMP-binding protein [Candidatus Binatus sp.]|uniref:acyl-CoA synthetase n=1 Tax=Candidatus Binatus sp. TaxID=2811406 RepID=UPI002717C422|nr:AMP-binding protein [Candidatus Binatus sp.]MDO8434589.1 AMP-binding protein [Candidatus Binatus sp.]
MIGLKEQTVRGAKTFAELRAMHRWNIPADYNVAIDCLDRHVELRDKVALLYEDDDGHTARYTFAQMIEATNRFANALRGLGIGRGDVVAVHTPQRPETAIAHIACYRLGAIALPISKLFGPDAIEYRLSNSAAKAILMEPETVQKIDAIDRKTLPNFKHVIVTDGGKGGLSFDELLSKGAPSFTTEKSSAEDPVLLMYTSGTTGNPKGVLHVARYVLGHNGIDYSYNYLRDGDLYYSPADWAWAGGLLDGLLAIWPYGIPVLAYRSKARFDPDVTFKLLEKYGASVGLYPPTALKVLREVKRPRDKYKLKLRCIVSGAEPVSPQLARWVDEELRVEFNQGFGQTEANYFIGTCSAIEKARLEPLGKPYPGHDVAIVSPEGVPLKTGEAGEIAIRRDSPVVMREYWKNPAAMSEKFKGEWCMTGDLGHMDDEGYVYFQGRNDDVIKSSGYRIGPSEIEAKIMEHKSVASCAVIGIPDPQRGQAIKAFVKLLPGFTPSAEMIKEIQTHVKTRLAAHEAPREIEFLDEFPSTVTGKIMRRELRAREQSKAKS